MLVCLDRSPTSEACLPTAIAVARSTGAAMTLLHVVEPVRGDGARPTNALDWQIRLEESRRYLETQKRRCEKHGIATRTRMVTGPAAERIVASMETIDADLTVLARHPDSLASQ